MDGIIWITRGTRAPAWGTEYPPGSGVFYFRKPIHYVINPSWDDEKIIKEMSYAFGRKIELVGQRETADVTLKGIKYHNVVTNYFASKFTDGTKVEFITRSVDIDPVTNSVVTNHLSLMRIVK